jgi:hypothetical protein
MYILVAIKEARGIDDVYLAFGLISPDFILSGFPVPGRFAIVIASV